MGAHLYCEWFVRYPPLGLLYQASLFKKQGHDILLLDGELAGLTVEKILKLCKKFQPDILFSTINIFNPQNEFKSLKILKDNLNCKLIARGHFPRLYPEQTILNKHIDYALTGKGFTASTELIDKIARNQATNNIKGIIYRTSDGKTVKTEDENQFDFNLLPMPARELIDNNIYNSALTLHDKFTTMTASIGCPYSCTYCIDKTIKYQSSSNEKIVLEMEECQNKYKIKEIAFLDSTFTIDRKKTIDLCNLIIKKRLKVKWVIRTRVDLVDEEIIDKLVEAGCISIHYGIESGNQTILNNLNRKITLEQIRTAVTLTEKKGLLTLGFFMIGNKGETSKTIEDTINFAKEIPLHFAQFNVVLALPETYMAENIKLNTGRDLWLESYLGKDIPAHMWKPQETDLSYEELTSWSKKTMHAFYLRPAYILKMLKSKFTYSIIIQQFRIIFLLLKIYIRKLLK